MPDYRVTDPDTGKTFVLTGDSPPTEAELEDVFSGASEYQPPTNFQEGVADDVSMFGNIAEGGLRTVIDNAAMLPNAVGELAGTALAGATAGVQTVGSGIAEGLKRNISTRPNFDMVTGEPFNFRDELSSNYEAARNTFPASFLIDGYDAPTSVDLQARAMTTPGSIAQSAYQYRTPGEYDNQSLLPPRRDSGELTDMGQTFADARDEILEGVLQRRAAHPIGASGGDLLGDIVTVIGGRAPVVRWRRNARLNKGKEPSAPVKEMEPGFRRWADRKVNQYKDWFKTSGYEIGETGVEGAVLAALQDEDPLVGAAFGAGTQSVANVSQHIWEEVPDLGMKPGLTRTGTKAGITAFGIASLVQVFKELTPGGRDRILESEESGYRKAAIAMAIGAMTQAAGFGRPTKGQLDNLGMLVDTWHSARRASVMSLVSEMENDDSGDVARIWTQMAQDPSYFDTTANRRLTRAFEDDEISMTGAIESLMEADRKFRRQVIALRDQRDTAPFDRTRERFDQGVDFMSDRMDRLIEE